MTWEQFTDVLPVLTLILGYGGSQFSDRRRERHERDRIVLQRAADVEGEALLALQDLLPELQVEWFDWLDRWGRHEMQLGGLDPDAAYEAAVKAGRPRQRANLLSSRITDDALRQTVQSTIELVYPFNHRDFSRMLSGGTHPYDDYPFDEAQQAIAETTEAIGRRLRQAAADAARRGR